MPPKWKDITYSSSSSDEQLSSETSHNSDSSEQSSERLKRLRSEHHFTAPSERLQESLNTLLKQTEHQTDKEDIQDFLSSVQKIQERHANNPPKISQQLFQKIESVNLFATNEAFLQILNRFKDNMNTQQSNRDYDISAHLAKLNSLPFLPSNNSQEDIASSSHDSSYAEQGSTEPKAINRLAQTFVDAARRPKLSDGGRRPPLGIHITDDQCTLVQELLAKDATLDKAMWNVAYKAAHNASDTARANKAAYKASDEGRARQAEAQARYVQTPGGRKVHLESVTNYHQTEKGKKTRERAKEKHREKK